MVLINNNKTYESNEFNLLEYPPGADIYTKNQKFEFKLLTNENETYMATSSDVAIMENLGGNG